MIDRSPLTTASGLGLGVLRQRINVMSEELASGKAADTGAALRGDFSRLSELRHGAALDRAHLEAMRTLGTWGEAGQTAIGRLDAGLAGLAEHALSADRPEGLGALAREAKATMGDMLGALSVRVAGRAVFAGGTDGKMPLPDAPTLISAASAAAAGAADIDQVTERMTAFFEPGGGFDALLGDRPVASFPTGEGRLDFPLDPGSDGLRAALRAAVTLAILPETGAADAAPATLGSAVITGVTGARAALAADAGRLGAVEARAAQRLEALESGLLNAERKEAELLAVDPFETASRLQDEMSRLETSYAVVARLGRLRLTDYL